MLASGRRARRPKQWKWARTLDIGSGAEAEDFKKAIEAGRDAHEIGLAEKLRTAAATSPLTGFFSNQAHSDNAD